MPDDGMAHRYGPDRSKMQRAWVTHYMAKGCTRTKAEHVAGERVRRKNTWPPTVNRAADNQE